MQKPVEIILAIIVVGTTLAFGGVQPITYSLMEIALFGAVALLFLKSSPDAGLFLNLPVWPVLFAILVLLQIVSLPFWLVARLSPVRALDPKLVEIGHHASFWTTLSIYPHDTVLGLIKFLAYLSAFVLAAYAFESRRRRSTLLIILMVLGGVEAAYGLVQYLTGWQQIFTYTKIDYRDDATGTYINHNHFAGCLELTLPFVMAAAFYFFQLWSENRGRREAASAQSSAGIQSIFYLFMALIMAVAGICSHSRAGVLGLGISTIVMTILTTIVVVSRKRAGAGVWAIGVTLFLTLLVCYAFWVGLDPLLRRFELIHDPGYLEMEGRLGVWKSGIRLVRDYVLTGSGLGTFGLGFRHYQNTGLNFFFDHAHNDYLEFASDTGIIGALLLFLPIVYLLVRMVIQFIRDPRRYRRAVILGCIGSTLALLIHSAMDFNLQIPANALILAIVLGIGYKAACIEPREAPEPAVQTPYVAAIATPTPVRRARITPPAVRSR